MPPKRKQPIDQAVQQSPFTLLDIELIVEKVLHSHRLEQDQVTGDRLAAIEETLSLIQEQLKEIDGELKNISSRGIVWEAEVNSLRQSGSVGISQPKASSQKEKAEAVKALLKDRLDDVTDVDLDSILEILKRCALSVCRAFVAANDNNAYRGWGSLSGSEQWNLLLSMQEEAMEIDPRLSFFGECARLWPCEFILQPKWTQKSKHARSGREIANAKEIIAEYQQRDN